MQTRLLIPGRRETHPLPVTDLGDFLCVDVVHAATVEGGARGGDGLMHEFADAADDDVLEFGYDDGVRRWTSVAQYRDDVRTGDIDTERGGALVVQAVPSLGGTTRGVADWILRGLRVLRIQPEKMLAAAAAREIAAHFESKLSPGPGLYRTATTTVTGEPITARTLQRGDREQPLLLLLHGTFSNTSGSFGALCEPAQRTRWEEVLRAYGGMALAFEHRTLSQSPLDNALELAEQLPTGARLHIVSHSRGGLIGELLCLGGVSDAQLRLLPRRATELSAQDAHDRRQLSALIRLLRRKQLRIERFVRVACPARGTTLASERLDRYLSVFLNLLGWIPALQASALYAFTKATMLALVARRKDPRDLPGLEAQMPAAPLVRFLNHPGLRAGADLAVVAGDIEARTWSRKLLEMATDAFYLESHDLVVPTRSMYGGVQREGGAVFSFERGDDVNHFSYFRNGDTVNRMYAWLRRADAGAAGFQALATAPRETVGAAPRRRGPSGPRPVVFVVPGIMGSTLEQDDDLIWVSTHRLILGGMERLAIGRKNVEPIGLVASCYQPLIDYLSDAHEVRPFPFDWRLSVRDSGRRLAHAIKEALAETAEPVRIVAHSMGGLVCRALMAEQPKVWDALCERPSGCLVMLGTPNWGSYAVPRLLLGQEGLLKLLALVDVQHSPRKLLAWISRFPGLLDMLPRPLDDEADAWKFFEPGTWSDLRGRGGAGWVAPDAEDLRRMAADLLDPAAPHPERIFYVAGCGRKATPVGLIVENGRVRFKGTQAGDGRVTYARGRLPGVRMWYTDAEHGDLATHEPAFAGILELLERGDTQRLEREPPAAARGPAEVFDLPADEPSCYPDEAELLAAAAGARPRRRGAARAVTLRVSAVHGDLTEARFPILVGHHEGDVIVSAERVIDRELGGELSRRHYLGVYPGAIGTAAVVLKAGKRLRGCLVVGLGPVGHLTANALAESVAVAALQYALAAHTQAASADETIGMSALLVGAGFGSLLSIDDSIAAIVSGVLAANRKLRAQNGGTPPCIGEMDLVELYEDRAIAAAHVVQALEERLRLEPGERIVAAERLRETRSGRRRTVAWEGAESWWGRIEISALDDHTLRFTRLTDRAGAPQIEHPVQTALIDRLVGSSIRKASADDDISATLFELLIPAAMKETVSQGRDLVLVVDGETANYPWELLCDRTRGRNEPPAVRAGLIRQLRVEDVALRRYATAASALVVGDPLVDAPGFRQLPGAQGEAEHVARELEQFGYKAPALLQPTGVEVMNALFAADYQVVHLAGHGVFDKDNPGQSGMVLDRGTRLTANEIAQLPSLPQLVFLNCCHLGQIDRSFNRLAAGIAVTLMKVGVRAVVAAGWEVDDGAAKRFATILYRELLTGTKFGDAVQRARWATYQDNPHVNTWGAYQCYGDPEFTLTLPAAGARRAAAVARPALARREVLDRLDELCQNARGRGMHTDAIRDAIGRVVADLPAPWRRDGRVLGSIGRAFGEVNDFERAVAAYRDAIALEDASAPLATVEQLVNLSCRWAVGVACERRSSKAGAADLDNAKATVRDAIARLSSLLKIAETSERWSLLGSAYKRLAQLEDGDARQEALQHALAAYTRAAAHARRSGGSEDPYPTLNQLTFEWLLGRRPGKHQEILARCEDATRRRLLEDHSFWNAVGAADAGLVRHLYAGDLHTAAADIAAQYLDALPFGSKREFQSVIDQLEFLTDMLHPAGAKPRRGKAVAAKRERKDAGNLQALDSILRELRKAMGDGS